MNQKKVKQKQKINWFNLIIKLIIIMKLIKIHLKLKINKHKYKPLINKFNKIKNKIIINQISYNIHKF